MKLSFRSFASLSLSFICAVFVLFSCAKDSKKDVATPSEDILVVEKSNRFNDLFDFPAGTELSVENGALQFNLPEGYALIVKKANPAIGEEPIMEFMGGGSITCNCTEGSGCSPYTVGEQSGCSVENGSCTQCIMTISKDLQMMRSNETVQFIDAAIVNLNESLNFITNEEIVTEMTSPKGFIFDAPSVQAKIVAFMAEFNTERDDAILANLDSELPKAYKYTATAFNGQLIFLPINKTSSANSRMASYSLAAGGHSCSCNEGSGCTEGSTWTPKGKIRYCEAGACTSCTLSSSSLMIME